jgi:hypothetical protein
MDLALSILFACHYPARAQSVRPLPNPSGQATTALAGTDAAAQTAAVAQIKTWINGGWASQDLWRKWFPNLARAGRHRIGWAAGGIAASLKARVRGGLVEVAAGHGGGRLEGAAVRDGRTRGTRAGLIRATRQSISGASSELDVNTRNSRLTHGDIDHTLWIRMIC